MSATTVELAGYAISGSLLAELVVANGFLCRGRGLPPHYRMWAFYLTRGGIAIGAGVLPLVFSAQTPKLAFSLGLVAPLAISRIAGVISAVLNGAGSASGGEFIEGDTRRVPPPPARKPPQPRGKRRKAK